MRNKGLQTTAEILQELNIVPPWIESRGRKPKYFFHTMQKGDIQKKIVPLTKARTIQTSMKQAANRQHIAVTIQNHGTYLLIKRTK